MILLLLFITSAAATSAAASTCNPNESSCVIIINNTQELYELTFAKTDYTMCTVNNMYDTLYNTNQRVLLTTTTQIDYHSQEVIMCNSCPERDYIYTRVTFGNETEIIKMITNEFTDIALDCAMERVTQQIGDKSDETTVNNSTNWITIGSIVFIVFLLAGTILYLLIHYDASYHYTPTYVHSPRYRRSRQINVPTFDYYDDYSTSDDGRNVYRRTKDGHLYIPGSYPNDDHTVVDYADIRKDSFESSDSIASRVQLYDSFIL